MSVIINQSSPGNNSTDQSIHYDSGIKSHAIVAYVLLIAGLFTAIPILIGAVWAMVKKSSAIGTIYHSHYVNATRTFWWTLFWTILGCILAPVGIGLLMLGGVWVWAFYRLVKGFAEITSDQAYPL
jgi:uncharacterized membrane protein